MQQPGQRLAPYGVDAIHHHRQVLGCNLFGVDEIERQDGVEVIGKGVVLAVAAHRFGAHGRGIAGVGPFNNRVALRGGQKFAGFIEQL